MPNDDEFIAMQIKFYGDVIPLSDLKINPAQVVSRAHDSHLPILLTSSGSGVAVLQELEDYEKTAEELRFVKATVRGLAEAIKGSTVSLEEARQSFGIK